VELDRRSRAAIVIIALACFIGAFGFAPLSARSAADTLAFPAPLGVHPQAIAQHLAIIPAQRDPFSGASDADTQASPAPFAIPRIPATIGGLPSNLTGMIPLIPGMPGASAPGEATRISAVVTGEHPYALVSEGTQNVLKGIGDRIDGLRIMSITIDGVLLEGGQLRRVTSSTAPTHALPTLPVTVPAPPVPPAASLPSPTPPGSPS